MTFRKELFTFIHPSSSHAVQPPPPPTQASPLPILLTIIPSLKPIKHPPPHPIITLIPLALYNTLFSLLSHYCPQSVSMHSPAPPDPTLSLNIIPKTYHSLYIMITPPPPHSYSSTKIHRSSRTLTFNPQSLIHIFFLIAQFCIQLCLQSYCQRFKQKSISRLIATKH